jgi:hypothetical protein
VDVWGPVVCVLDAATVAAALDSERSAPMGRWPVEKIASAAAAPERKGKAPATTVSRLALVPAPRVTAGHAAKAAAASAACSTATSASMSAGTGWERERAQDAVKSMAADEGVGSRSGGSGDG